MSTVVRSSLYRSSSAALEFTVRPEIPDLHPIRKDKVGILAPRLRVEFGIQGPEQSYYNPATGRMETTATTVGGYFDLDAVADDKGWSDEDKELVRARLDEECRIRPSLVQRLDFERPEAPRPWPTYDAVEDEETILTLAEQIGVVGQALAYERENRNREELVRALAALSDEVRPESIRMESTLPDRPDLIATPPTVIEANRRSAQAGPGDDNDGIIEV